MYILNFMILFDLFLQSISTKDVINTAIVWSTSDLDGSVYVPSLKYFLNQQSSEDFIDKDLVQNNYILNYTITEETNKNCTPGISNFNFVELFNSGLDRKNLHKLNFTGLIVLDCLYDCNLGSYLSDVYSLIETIGNCYKSMINTSNSIQITPPIEIYFEPLKLFLDRNKLRCYIVVTSSKYDEYYEYENHLDINSECHIDKKVAFQSNYSNDINIILKSIKQQVKNVLNIGIRVIILISSNLDIFQFLATATVLGKNNGDFMFLAFNYKYIFENSQDNIYNLKSESLASIQKYLISINLNFLNNEKLLYKFYKCSTCDINNILLETMPAPKFNSRQNNDDIYTTLLYAFKYNIYHNIRRFNNDSTQLHAFLNSSEFNMTLSSVVNFIIISDSNAIPIFSYNVKTNKTNMSLEAESILRSFWLNFPPKDQSIFGYKKQFWRYSLSTIPLIFLASILSSLILIGIIVMIILYLKYKLLVFTIRNYIISPNHLQFKKKMSRNSEILLSVKSSIPKESNLHLDTSLSTPLKKIDQKVSPSISDVSDNQSHHTGINDDSINNFASTIQLQSVSDNSNKHNNLCHRKNDSHNEITFNEDHNYNDFLISVLNEKLHYESYGTNVNNINIKKFPRQQCLTRYNETRDSSLFNLNVNAAKERIFKFTFNISNLFSYIKININLNNCLNTKLYENTKDVQLDLKYLNKLNKLETTYQDRIVFVKSVGCKKLKIHFLNTSLLQEILMMRDLNHENIVSFIGICFSLNLIVTAYAKRGSLYDLLNNKNHARVFNLPLLTQMLIDIAKGMDYLHSSELGSHGSLTSKCCVIDGRWRCKVTDYGLGMYRMCDKIKLKNLRPNEKEMIKLLYIAPELLRTPKNMRPTYGTRTADIYAFAIIIQEVLLMDIPYANELLKENMTYKSILVKVRLGKKKEIMRPNLGEYQHSKWALLTKDCWHESPDRRLSFQQIGAVLKEFMHSRKATFTELLSQRLEEHANNLKGMVIDATASVALENAKCDELLYNLLPKIVADEMKLGKIIEPELYKSVTLLNTDIVGFTTIASKSTPLEIVELLSMLYSTYDSMTGQRDAYKVETVGDAYNCCSGCPIRNGDRHANEIAILSLDFFNYISHFKIPHLDNEVLNARCGIHSGPVITGVVGRKAPRFCLFGETCIISEAMEGTSLANCIHISKATVDLLNKSDFLLEERGMMDIDKEKMETYFLLSFSTSYRLRMKEA